MFALRRGLGVACIRLCIIPMERRKLDTDKISEPVIRDPNSGVDRFLEIFDRK